MQYRHSFPLTPVESTKIGKNDQASEHDWRSKRLGLKGPASTGVGVDGFCKQSAADTV